MEVRIVNVENTVEGGGLGSTASICKQMVIGI